MNCILLHRPITDRTSGRPLFLNRKSVLYSVQYYGSGTEEGCVVGGGEIYQCVILSLEHGHNFAFNLTNTEKLSRLNKFEVITLKSILSWILIG